MAWERFPLLGFVPALPVTTPGCIVKVDGAVPTDRGYGNSPEFAAVSTSAMDFTSVGAASLYKTDGTNRIFAGTSDKLYELNSLTLNDRSGTSYAATTTAPWSFAQFGDITIAANLNNTTQFVGAASTFADISGAPKASIAIAVGPVTAQFVMLFDTNDGTHVPDKWISSGINDYTNWTAAVNLAANGRLLDEVPGPITAAIPFRDGALAFKNHATYLATFNGFNPVWQWQRLSSDIGCIGKNALVVAGDVVYFADAAGLWYFDGSYPRPIDQKINKFWADEVAARVTGNTAAQYWVHANWDRAKHLLTFSLPNGSGLGVLELVCWNKVSGLWSLYSPPATVWEMFSADDYTDTTKKVGAYDYVQGTGTANIYTHILGDATQDVRLQGIRPGWTIGPSVGAAGWLTGQAQALADVRSAQPNSISGGASATFSFKQPGYLDGDFSSRYVSPIITITNSAASTGWEFDSYYLDISPAGRSGP